MIIVSTAANAVETSLRTTDRVINIVDILAETAQIYTNELVLDARCKAYCTDLDRKYTQNVANAADKQRTFALRTLAVDEKEVVNPDVANFQ